jgi:uncharacterized protein with HEPN domain
MAGGRSIRARLLDMIEAAEGLRAAVEGQDFADFEQDWVVQRAVERALEIISEASRHLPAEAKAVHAAVPWPQVAAIGNVLRHEYQRVEPRLIWNLVTAHLPPLEAAIRAMLASLDEGPATPP